jgi:hypothetical protein
VPLRTFLTLTLVLVLLGAGLAGGWIAMNYYAPSDAGTPAHAGIVSNGRPDECTNVNFSVPARRTETRSVLLGQGDLLRGTFEAQGGWGRVDILMRIVSPQGLEILASPKAENYDFTLPAQIRGEYEFVFDNRYSLYTSKSVGLFYCVERQP